MGVACPLCTCTRGDEAGLHALLAALVADDVDAAIELGLLAPTRCEGCTPACHAHLDQARAQRRDALAARERFRQRGLRLARRTAQREAARTAPPATATGVPALPAAAADALARALAKAGGRTLP